MKILDHPVGDLKAYFASKVNVLFLHHPHDTMSFFKKENPSVYGQVLALYFAEHFGSPVFINISSYFISYLPANFSLVYL
jgi:hypothetical protein